MRDFKDMDLFMPINSKLSIFASSMQIRVIYLDPEKMSHLKHDILHRVLADLKQCQAVEIKTK